MAWHILIDINRIMVCCLSGDKPLPELVLNYCTTRNIFSNFNWHLELFIHENAFEDVVWKTSAILVRSQCLCTYTHTQLEQLSHQDWITGKLMMVWHKSRWRRCMETRSALLALCEGNPPTTVDSLTKLPVTQSFDVLFAVRLHKLMNIQSSY